MTVRGLPKGASPSANVAEAVCDSCGATKRAVCDYERRPTGKWEPNEAQVVEKVIKAGWTNIKRVLRCPECSQRRTEPQTAGKDHSTMKPTSTVITELRQPTRDQKREIVQLLTACYDVQAGRYRGADTDKTIAEAVGGGCMPGWVAQQREDLFGPDGGNETIEQTIAEIAAWKDAVEARLTEVSEAMQGMTAKMRDARSELDKVQQFQKRLEAIKAAVGPKAGAA
jgi:hypothetical protein